MKVSPPDWDDKVIYRDDVRERYPELADYGMPEKVEEGFSRTMCWFLRRRFAELGVPSFEFAGSAGWYEVETLREAIENNRHQSFSTKDFIYVVGNSAGKRFMLYNRGRDIKFGLAETKVYVKCATGHHVLLLPSGEMDTADHIFSDDQEMVPEKDLPTGFAYHGTYLSLYRKILDTGLRPGGDGRSERLMNHLSPSHLEMTDKSQGCATNLSAT